MPCSFKTTEMYIFSIPSKNIKIKHQLLLFEVKIMMSMPQLVCITVGVPALTGARRRNTPCWYAVGGKKAVVSCQILKAVAYIRLIMSAEPGSGFVPGSANTYIYWRSRGEAFSASLRDWH